MALSTSVRWNLSYCRYHFSLTWFTGCHEYSLPEHVAKHIDLISPTVNAPVKRSFEQHESLRKRRALDKRGAPPNGFLRGPIQAGSKLSAHVMASLNVSTCGQFITPDCLRALYNINRTPTQTKKNTFQICGLVSLVVTILSELFKVELTPQSFVQSDLDSKSCAHLCTDLTRWRIVFFANFSKNQVQKTPNIVLMDGGKSK
jgi:tripeptidyl-peptidase I